MLLARTDIVVVKFLFILEAAGNFHFVKVSLKWRYFGSRCITLYIISRIILINTADSS